MLALLLKRKAQALAKANAILKEALDKKATERELVLKQRLEIIGEQGDELGECIELSCEQGEGVELNVEQGIERAQSTRCALEDKPWNEIQNGLKRDLEMSRLLAGSEEKIPFKLGLIEKYRALVKRLIATHKNLDGLEVLWWFYLWHVDCGLLEDIHAEFKALILRGIETPTQWSSNGQTAYCDIVFKYTKGAVENKRKANFEYLTEIVRDVTAGVLAINAPLKIKIFRLQGDLFLMQKQHKEALVLFNIVMAMDPKKGGRKKLIKEIESTITAEQPNKAKIIKQKNH